MQDLPCASDLARPAHRRGAALSATVERLRSLLCQVRGEVAWAPLVARALATTVALLGLAGIGLAASRSPELTELTRAPISASLAQLAGTGLSATLGAGGDGGRAPAVAVGAAAAGNAAPPQVNAAAPAANGTETPCPRSPAEDPRTEAGEAAPATGGAGSARPAPAGSHAKGSGLVILNRADASEFQRLPGVGAKRAVAIVELRKRLGRFRRPSDLLRVKGIGPKTLERMLPQLALDAPP